uniref:Uncharacterized protein n=1 Tax=candidate division WOR-3 bacterium TaxID=2052148 RepID=A0A7C4XTW7_UNCW3
MIDFFCLFLIFNQIGNVSPTQEVRVKIQTTKEESYYLLTRKQPLEIKVSGPTWIRVYSRIPWTKGKTGTVLYKMILEEDEIKEKFITTETEYSSVARLDKIKLSKWRSFYINVPEGMHTYRLIHWRCPSDSILLKFTSESPGRWQDIPALSYNAKLELVEDEKIIDYYEMTPEKPVILEIDGPKKLKVISRLNLKPAIRGEEVYSIDVIEKGKTVKSTKFRAWVSETAYYNKRADIIPSNPHIFFLNVRKGSHRYEFFLKGGTSCGMRFMIETK